MSLVIEDRTCFSGFCPCLYYNAVLGHVKQDWLCQPCLACILLITFPIFLRRKFPAENGSVPNPDGVPSISWWYLSWPDTAFSGDCHRMEIPSWIW